MRKTDTHSSLEQLHCKGGSSLTLSPLLSRHAGQGYQSKPRPQAPVASTGFEKVVVRGAGDGEKKDGNDDENRQARPVLPPDKHGGTPCLLSITSNV